MKGTHPRFAEARAQLHAIRRAESEKAFDLMIEYIKLRQGNVTSEELGRLFHSSGLPYPASLYVLAREKAVVPLKKVINRNPPRSRWPEMQQQWKELIATTPDPKRPRVVESALTVAMRGPVSSVAPVAEIADFTRASTADLIRELLRRRDEAQGLLKMLGGLPLGTETAEPEEEAP